MIRLAKPNDLSRIVEIYNQTISTRVSTADMKPVTVQDRQNWYDSHNDRYPLFVFEESSHVCGWSSLKPFYGREAYRITAEVGIYVDQGFRRKKIGRFLLEHTLAAAKRSDFEAILGFIFAHNHPSIELFKRFDFAEWGKLPQIAKMDSQRFDLLIFGLHLNM